MAQGRASLIGELNKLRKRACSLSGAGLRLKMWFLFLLASLVSHSNSFFFRFSSALDRAKAYFLFSNFFPFDNLAFSNHSLPLSFASAGCPAIRRRQPEESAGEGEAGSVSHATLHPSRLSEPPPWHDRSGRHQKTNGQFH